MISGWFMYRGIFVTYHGKIYDVVRRLVRRLGNYDRFISELCNVLCFTNSLGSRTCTAIYNDMYIVFDVGDNNRVKALRINIPVDEYMFLRNIAVDSAVTGEEGMNL